MPPSPSDIFSNMIQVNVKVPCSRKQWDEIWTYMDMFILITGVVSNAALLWLLLRERKSLSASKVLGLNLVVMDLLFLSIMPVSLTHNSERAQLFERNYSVTINQMRNTTDQIDKARHIFSMFNLVGCPLLLTCMCVERYLAVMRPVLYMKARKWEYRMALSAVVWAITLSFCLATFLEDDLAIISVSVSIIISCLFLIMLICLGRVVWSLLQQSPAHSTHGNQQHSESPLKRQAVGNVLVVVVPSVTSYLPVLPASRVQWLQLCKASQSQNEQLNA
ncbi:P2Y purinoceptor 1-like protein [Lates japonicus]|uniref:P2Y purinoceptor 1-like protein n=1 Tax=Lates japonicus TaxID=270547 RepID=A0AAD3M632_LATJO|nr:P2Y purinoceptor 1-like protein [Lates japonicus]